MELAGKFKKFLHHHSSAVMIGLSFLLWIFLFRDFLSGKSALVYDAISYYDHIKFYIENIRHGVFPLWDPVWSYGSPNDFFLRRIGPFNPCLFLIPLFDFLGLTYTRAYLAYLAVYYLIGLIGFYLLANRLFGDRKIAFAAYALLLFSALGTRLFDSYIVLMCVPMAWFFYFLTAFTQNPQRRYLLGMTFALMNVMTTYIPFYFITVLLLFLACFVVVYARDLSKIFVRYFAFLKNNKIFMVFCIVAFLCACAPGFIFFKDSRKGEFVLPSRYSGASVDSALAVGNQMTNPWSFAEEVMYSSFFWL